jgi:hypothetical protein
MHRYPATGGTGKQLPQVLASSSAGVPLSFGGLSVTRQGLSIDHGRKTLPWSEVGPIERSRHHALSIGKQGKFWDGDSRGHMPKALTFLEWMYALGRK